MNRCSVLGALLACLVTTSSAGAQTTDAALDPPTQTTDPALDARARIHFQAGTDYFERGDYEGALRELQIAHEMSGRAALLYNIGACLERLGRFTEAADQLEAYVGATSPEDASAIRERARRLRARGEASASPSTSEPSDEVSAPAEVSAPPVMDEVIEAPAPSPRTPHVASWITLGVGGAALAAFGVLGGLALGEDASLADRCGTRCSPSDVSSLESLSVAADVSLSVGLALVATGIVLALVTDDSHPADAARLELGPGGPRVRF